MVRREKAGVGNALPGGHEAALDGGIGSGRCCIIKPFSVVRVKDCPEVDTEQLLRSPVRACSMKSTSDAIMSQTTSPITRYA